jgi:hypothetical protein
MSLEYLVRPFQSPDAFGRTRLPSAPGRTERATLTWGAKTAPGTLPKAKTTGFNVECCNEISTQSSSEASGVDIFVTGPDAEGISFRVNRSDVVVAKKKEDNKCDDWLANNSFVASGVKEAFAELHAEIHASDADFMPEGSNPECKQKTTFKYDGG